MYECLQGCMKLSLSFDFVLYFSISYIYPKGLIYPGFFL